MAIILARCWHQNAFPQMTPRAPRVSSVLGYMLDDARFYACVLRSGLTCPTTWSNVARASSLWDGEMISYVPS